MHTMFSAVANKIVKKNNTKKRRTMMIIYGRFIYFLLYHELRLAVGRTIEWSKLCIRIRLRVCECAVCARVFIFRIF